jgi:hypothetical protein
LESLDERKESVKRLMKVAPERTMETFELIKQHNEGNSNWNDSNEDFHLYKLCKSIILEKKLNDLLKKQMRVRILKSIEGNEYQEVILEKELVDALFEFNEANKSLTFLMLRGILNDEVKEGLSKIINDCKDVFHNHGLTKYDIRANYKFEESILIDE